MIGRNDASWLLERLTSHALGLDGRVHAIVAEWVEAGRQGVPLQVSSHADDTFWLCCCRYDDGTAYHHDADTDDCCDCGMSRP